MPLMHSINADDMMFLVGLLLGLAVGFVASWTVQRRKTRRADEQLRCLYYCFMEISDWGIGRVKEIRDGYVSEHGRGLAPTSLLEIEEEWGKEIDALLSLLKRVRFRPPANHRAAIGDILLR